MGNELSRITGGNIRNMHTAIDPLIGSVFCNVYISILAVVGINIIADEPNSPIQKIVDFFIFGLSFAP